MASQTSTPALRIVRSNTWRGATTAPAQLRPITTSIRPSTASSSFTRQDTSSSSTSYLRHSIFLRPSRHVAFLYTSSRHLAEITGESSNPSHIPIKEMTSAEYEEASDEDMDKLHERLEILCEQYGPDDWEVEYSSGVMTLHIPPHGTFVINKQPPNQQIWISSPLSGPARFGYSPDRVWVHHRKEGITLGRLLEEELRALIESGRTGWEGTGLR